MDQKFSDMVREAKAQYLADASMAYDDIVAPYVSIIRQMTENQAIDKNSVKKSRRKKSN